MRRSAYLVLALTSASATAWAEAADLSPQDFAYGMLITTPAPAAAYRVAVPLEVYRRVVQRDPRCPCSLCRATLGPRSMACV